MKFVSGLLLICMTISPIALGDSNTNQDLVPANTANSTPAPWVGEWAKVVAPGLVSLVLSNYEDSQVIANPIRNWAALTFAGELANVHEHWQRGNGTQFINSPLPNLNAATLGLFVAGVSPHFTRPASKNGYGNLMPSQGTYVLTTHLAKALRLELENKGLSKAQSAAVAATAAGSLAGAFGAMGVVPGGSTLGEKIATSLMGTGTYRLVDAVQESTSNHALTAQIAFLSGYALLLYKDSLPGLAGYTFDFATNLLEAAGMHGAEALHEYMGNSAFAFISALAFHAHNNLDFKNRNTNAFTLNRKLRDGGILYLGVMICGLAAQAMSL